MRCNSRLHLDLVFRITMGLLLICLIEFSSGSALFAQRAKKPEKKELPPVEEITITTKDDVILHCTWYPGPAEKNSVPVILLHGWKQDRQIFKDYGASLQKEHGCAVLIPDLRGHGESTMTTGDKELDLERFGKAEFATFYKDIEQCGRFLQDKNNKGELNLEMLVLIAAEESSLLACEYAIGDWSWPDFKNQKQGKFVKALVLLTPSKRFMGLSISPMLRTPVMTGRGARAMPIMVAAGSSDQNILREAKAFHKLIENKRPVVKPKGKTAAEKQVDYFQRETAFFYQLPVDGEGAALLQGKSQMPAMIQIFLDSKVKSQADQFAWQMLPDR